MTLSEWCAAKGRGAKTELARRTGLAYSTVHWTEVGRTRPSLRVARAIAAATDGSVTVADLIGLRDGEAR